VGGGGLAQSLAPPHQSDAHLPKGVATENCTM
jgi:hypothetical protein